MSTFGREEDERWERNRKMGNMSAEIINLAERVKGHGAASLHEQVRL